VGRIAVEAAGFSPGFLLLCTLFGAHHIVARVAAPLHQAYRPKRQQQHNYCHQWRIPVPFS
jgi:hypothetical protein